MLDVTSYIRGNLHLVDNKATIEGLTLSGRVEGKDTLFLPGLEGVRPEVGTKEFEVGGPPRSIVDLDVTIRFSKLESTIINPIP